MGLSLWLVTRCRLAVVNIKDCVLVEFFFLKAANIKYHRNNTTVASYLKYIIQFFLTIVRLHNWSSELLFLVIIQCVNANALLCLITESYYEKNNVQFLVEETIEDLKWVNFKSLSTPSQNKSHRDRSHGAHPIETDVLLRSFFSRTLF